MTSESIEKYRRATDRLFEEQGAEKAAPRAVGGNYQAVGEILYRFLLSSGLRETESLVDVGSGSGRLAAALSGHGFGGRYLGTDISPQLLDYARGKVPDAKRFRFEAVDGYTIPAPDGSVDWVCFFSVFTHLLHEESFAYLQDALRVLKPGGKAVISYLDFAVPKHWNVFERTVKSIGMVRHHNVFMHRDLFAVWAGRLGCRMVFEQPGGAPFIVLPEPVTFDNGERRKGLAALGPVGQSVVIMQKPTG